MKLEKICRLFGFAIFLILMSGCATTTQQAFIPIDQSMQESIQSTNAFICFRQQEFCLPTKKSNITTYTGGGLIPALIDLAIDSARVKEGKLNVQPLNDVFSQSGFASRFNEKITQELKQIDWLRIASTEENCIQTSDELDSSMANLVSSNVLVVNTLHQFTPDAKMMVLKTYLTLFPKGKSKSEDLIYKNSFVVRISLKEDVSSADEAVPLWLANDGDFIKLKMDEGLDLLVSLIKESLANPNNKSRTSVSLVSSPNE